MTSLPYARVILYRDFHRPGSRIVDSLEILAGLSLLTFSGNSYRRKESYTAVSPLERTSGAQVVAWVLPTLLCSAHAWGAIIAFRVRADCSVSCGGKAWKLKTF